MEFECVLANISKLNLNPQGLQKPLCDSCVTTECTNPIQKVNISLFGVTRECKLHVAGSGTMAVVACKGYMSKDSKQ